ncbi:hypothetical protein [Celeribacter sp. ULVN23_4]
MTSDTSEPILQETLPDLFDISDWPVARIRFPQLGEEDRVGRFARGMDMLIACDQPFSVIWYVADHDPEDEPREDDRAAHIWLKRVRKDLDRLVQGYAYVVPNQKMHEILHERVEKVASKLFSFPIFVTRDDAAAVAQAKSWVEGLSK